MANRMSHGGRHEQGPRGLNLDIDGWLRRVGLAQYAEMFRANDIDGELLRRLTNEDLKDIGVASFGHRKKLLEAIAELDSAPAPPPAVPDPTPTRATVARPPFSASIEAAGERRHVTVMFCDLVNFPRAFADPSPPTMLSPPAPKSVRLASTDAPRRSAGGSPRSVGRVSSRRTP